MLNITRMHDVLKATYLNALIHGQGAAKHQKHEANGSTKGEADQGWTERENRQTVTHNISYDNNIIFFLATM